MRLLPACPWRLAVAALLAGLLVAPATPPALAQTDEVAAVVRDAHAFIVEYALRPIDPGVLLQRAIAAVQQVATPVDSPPVLTGHTAEDVAASASFIASALRASASMPEASQRPFDSACASVARSAT